MTNKIYILFIFGLFLGFPLVAQDHFQRHSQIIPLSSLNASDGCTNYYQIDGSRCKNEVLSIRLVANKHEQDVSLNLTPTNGASANNWETGVTVHYNPVPSPPNGCSTQNFTLTIGEEWNSHQPLRQTYIDSEVIRDYPWQSNNAGIGLQLSTALPNVAIAQQAYIEIEWYTSSSSALVSSTAFNFSHNTLTDKAADVLYWDYVEGAHSYELEWVFWDAYTQTQMLFPSSTFTGTLQSDFIKNTTNYFITAPFATMAGELPFQDKEAVRITTSNQHFELPLNYPAGILFYRVRAIGYWDQAVFPFPVPIVPAVPATTHIPDSERERKVGAWQYSTLGAGSVPGVRQYSVLSEDFESPKLWQAVTTFAEEGKFKKVISYLDGTSRMRQTVTHLNSDETVLVAEQFYSAEGAASVQILPVPLLSQGLHYRDDVNYFAKTVGTGISASITQSRHKSAYEGTTAKLHPNFGAGKYYSANNPFLSSKNPIHKWYSQFTPNAVEGAPGQQVSYALSQTVMTNDNTQKVLEQGGVGKTFAIGQGIESHSTKYYYGTAAGDELTKLFGNNVGTARHYRKSLVQDANGQVSISYTNQEGKTVATALSDSKPANLMTLDKNTTAQNITVDLKDYQSVSLDGTELITEFNLLNSNVNNAYDFTYSNDLPLDCQGCSYEIEIKIIDNSTQLDAMDKVVLKLGKQVDGSGAISNIQSSPIPTAPNILASAVQLPVGSYTVRKIIRAVNPLSWDQTRNGIETQFSAPGSEVPLSLHKLKKDYLAALNATDQCNTSYPGSDWLQASLIATAKTDCGPLLPISREKIICQETVDSRVFVQKLSLIKNWTEAKSFFASNLNSKFYTLDPLFNHPVYGKPFIPVIENLLGAVMSAPNKLPVSIEKAVLNSTTDDVKRWTLFKALYIEAREKAYQQALREANSADLPAYIPATVPIPLTMEQKYWNWRNENAVLFFQNDPVALATALTDFIGSQCTYINNTTDKATLQGLLTTYFTHQNSYQNAAKLLNSPIIPNSDLAAIKNFLNTGITCALVPELLAVLFPPSTVTEVPQFYAPLLADATSTNDKQTPQVLEQQGDAINPTSPFSPSDFYLQAPALAELDQSKRLSVEFVIDHLAWTRIAMQNGTGSIEPDRMVPLLSRKLQGSYQYTTTLTNPFLPTTPVSTPTIELPYYFSVAAGVRQTTDKELIINPNTGKPVPDNNGNPATRLSDPVEQHYLVVHPFWFSPAIWKELKLHVVNADSELEKQLTRLQECKYEFPIKGGLQPCDQVKIVWEQMNCPALTVGGVAPSNCKIIKGFSIYVNGILIGSQDFPRRLANGLMDLTTGSLTTFPWNFPEAKTGNCLSPTPIFPATVCPLGAPWNRSGFSFDTQAPWNFGGTWMSKLAVAAVAATSTSPAQNPKDAQYANFKGAVHSIAFRKYDIVSDKVVARYEVINNNLGIHSNAATALSGYTLQKSSTSNLVVSQCLAAPQPYQEYNAHKNYDLTIPTIPTLAEKCSLNRKAVLETRYQEDYENELDRLTVLARSGLQECMRKFIKAPQIAAIPATGTSSVIPAKPEDFKITYTSLDKHYTLYYYDQAQNLVATVPPDGVRIIASTNANTRIVHNLMTHYAFNTIGQPIKQWSPDAGKTEFIYDKITRLRLSQNAEQAAQSALTSATTNPRFIASYTQYDAIGRTIEVGQTSVKRGAYFDTFIKDITSPEFPKHNGIEVINTQITHTNYDNAPITTASSFLTGVAQFGRNRITNTYTLAQGVLSTTNLASSQTWYAYDVHGNVKTLWQGVAGLETKQINYYYDLIAGKVNKVVYQPRKAGQTDIRDQFIHRYRYDGDNRLIATETSVDDLIYTQDASYFYYPHGPLARMELGHYKVQGLDYAYTLQGWLKGVNSIGEGDSTRTTGNTAAQQGHHDPLADIGADGYGVSQPATSPGFNNVVNSNPTHHALVGRDVFAFSLHYFQGDYQASSFKHMTTATKDAMYNQTKMTAAWASGKSLYNGNIAMMNTAIHTSVAGGTNLPVVPATGGNPAIPARNIPKLSALVLHQQMVYQYDQLNRIKTAQAAQAGVGSAPTNPLLAGAFKEGYTYDGNGNIKTLTRKNATVQIDDLTYEYIANTNQLARVRDRIANGIASNDIDNQVANNYVYDKIGNLIADKSEGIDSIKWTIYGKVARVVRKVPVTFPAGTPANSPARYDDVIIDYSYDAMGNRISKTVRRREALAYNEITIGWTAGTDFLGTEKTTYYVRDAQGNVLSIYDKGAYVKYRNTATLPNITWLVTPILADVLAPVPVRGTAAAPANNKPAPFPALPLALSEQIIYGSARIGAYKPQRNQTVLPPATPAPVPVRGRIMPILAGELTLGYKSYELSNHLGNVLTTISDNKMMVRITPSVAGGLVEVYLQTVVLTTQDYYPFGMAMTERGFSNVDRNSQRFGFNTQEKDLDIDQGGSHYTAEFWEYDGRTGRRWNIDPVVKADLSGYIVLGNCPILMADILGNDWYETTNKDGSKTTTWQKGSAKTWKDQNGAVYKNIGDTYRIIVENTTFIYKQNDLYSVESSGGIDTYDESKGDEPDYSMKIYTGSIKEIDRTISANFPYDPKSKATTQDYYNIAKWSMYKHGATIQSVAPDGSSYQEGVAAYSHYLSGSGKERKFSLSKYFETDYSGLTMNTTIQELLSENIPKLLPDVGTTSFHTNTLISGTESPLRFPYPSSINWQKAIGGFTFVVIGIATAEKIKGKLHYTIQYTVHAIDTYDFNASHQDVETGISDDENGRFSTLGWAKPYIHKGSHSQTIYTTK